MRIWFRRDPPHLLGRVPVDCGEGALTNRPVASVGVVWSPPPDEQGRAFLASCPPLPLHLRMRDAIYDAASRRIFTPARGWLNEETLLIDQR